MQERGLNTIRQYDHPATIHAHRIYTIPKLKYEKRMVYPRGILVQLFRNLI